MNVKWEPTFPKSSVSGWLGLTSLRSTPGMPTWREALMAKQSALTAITSGSVFFFTFRTIRKVTWPSRDGVKRTAMGNLHQRVYIDWMRQQVKCGTDAVISRGIIIDAIVVYQVCKKKSLHYWGLSQSKCSETPVCILSISLNYSNFLEVRTPFLIPPFLTYPKTKFCTKK